MSTTAKVEALMKRCRAGVGGRHALDPANEILAECYRMLGLLVQERDALLSGEFVCRKCRVPQSWRTTPFDSLNDLPIKTPIP